MSDGFDDIRAIANDEMTKALTALHARNFDLAVKLLSQATAKLQAIAADHDTGDADGMSGSR